jgi:CheY-like chemotaxis protein/HPt (histidine-containing phosphotransfer) domain-containing protein
MEIASREEKSGPIGLPKSLPDHRLLNTGARVLVVDDHPVNLLFMRKVLKKMGMLHVDEASGGLQALKFVRKTDYDLIFMDCQMPEMDGFEAAARIREVEDFANQVKIIAVTADAMKGARERCIDAGMNDYISKPVDIEKLLSIMLHWLPAPAPDLVQTLQMQSPFMLDAVERKSPEVVNAGNQIMDWQRLSMFTDDDPQEEAALIELFKTYAQESLEILESAIGFGKDDLWKKAAHKLKGSAANLGAVALSDLCFEAEKGFETSPEHKKDLYHDILNAYESVIRVLDSHRTSV